MKFHPHPDIGIRYMQTDGTQGSPAGPGIQRGCTTFNFALLQQGRRKKAVNCTFSVLTVASVEIELYKLSRLHLQCTTGQLYNLYNVYRTSVGEVQAACHVATSVHSSTFFPVKIPATS